MSHIRSDDILLIDHRVIEISMSVTILYEWPNNFLRALSTLAFDCNDVTKNCIKKWLLGGKKSKNSNIYQ